jgi:hypothetical protein
VSNRLGSVRKNKTSKQIDTLCKMVFYGLGMKIQELIYGFDCIVGIYTGFNNVFGCIVALWELL